MTELLVFDRGDEPLPETAVELLPAWRRERTARLKHAGARQESLAAGLLWRVAMGRRSVPAEAEVRCLPAGKPVLAGREDVWFSLSHSGRYALCAVSAAPVGADVQERRTVRPSMLRFFHPAEQAWLTGPVSGEEGDFFRLWARKEAWVKAVSGERMLSLAEADVIHPLPGLRFWDYELPGGFQAALCGAEVDRPSMIWVARTELLSAGP